MYVGCITDRYLALFQGGDPASFVWWISVHCNLENVPIFLSNRVTWAAYHDKYERFSTDIQTDRRRREPVGSREPFLCAVSHPANFAVIQKPIAEEHLEAVLLGYSHLHDVSKSLKVD